jgi:aryl-alcohol dehydrogenase-like predicted oxidoreductase
VVAYGPLGHGFLAGRYRSLNALRAADFRRTQPR